MQNLVNRSASSRHMGNLAKHVPTSTHLRILSFTLVDQVEIILRICSTQLNHPSIQASRHHMFQIIIEIS
jgi:hypothetical protein